MPNYSEMAARSGVPGEAPRAVLKFLLSRNLDSKREARRLYQMVCSSVGLQSVGGRPAQARPWPGYFLCWADTGDLASPPPAAHLAHRPIELKHATRLWPTLGSFVSGFGEELRRLSDLQAVLSDRTPRRELQISLEHLRGWLQQTSPAVRYDLSIDPAMHINILAAAYYGLALQLQGAPWISCLECTSPTPKVGVRDLYCSERCGKRHQRRRVEPPRASTTRTFIKRALPGVG